MSITVFDSQAALIAIDLQQGILGMTDPAEVERIVSRTAKLADAFHAAGLPVVWVTALGMPVGRTALPKPGGDGTPPADFTEPHPDLPVQDGDFHVHKKATSGFSTGELHPFLQGQGVTQVFITGLATGIGVESSVRAAFDHGYNVVVVEDAVTDGNKEREHNSLTNTLPALAELGTTDELLTALKARQ